MLYNKHNLDISKIVDKNDSRQNLRCVRFEKDKTIATDGHRLILMTVPDFNMEDYPVDPDMLTNETFKPVSIPLDTVRNFKINDKQKMPILNNCYLSNGNNGMYRINQNLLGSNPSIEFKPVDSEFPDYNRVIPTTKPIATISVNAGYLKDICEVLGKLSGKMQTIKIGIWDELSPITIESIDKKNNQYGLALLMPVRLGEDDPHFLKYPESVEDVWQWSIDRFKPVKIDYPDEPNHWDWDENETDWDYYTNQSDSDDSLDNYDNEPDYDVVW